jgi:hypothetical protein
LLLAAIITFSGCECVVSLDTKKKITPGNSSDAIFINAISDQDNISIQSDGIKLNSKSSFDASEAEYQKVQTGVSYLRFLAEDEISVIYNSPAEFNKDRKYTVFSYGSGFSINTLIIEDSLKLKPDLSLFRIVNLLKNSGELEFIFSDSTNSINHVVTYKSFTNFREIKSGSYKLSILNSQQDTVYKKGNVTLNQNSAYNITLTSRNNGGTLSPACSVTRIGL